MKKKDPPALPWWLTTGESEFERRLLHNLERKWESQRARDGRWGTTYERVFHPPHAVSGLNE